MFVWALLRNHLSNHQEVFLLFIECVIRGARFKHSCIDPYQLQENIVTVYKNILWNQRLNRIENVC